MQEKGQKCKNSDANLYTKKQAIIACLSNFLLNFLVSNVLFPYIAKALRTLLAPRSNSGRFKTTCGEFSPLMHSTIQTIKKQTLKICFLLLMAGTTRLELATSCVTGMRSNQLSYAPIFYCHTPNLISAHDNYNPNIFYLQHLFYISINLPH